MLLDRHMNHGTVTYAPETRLAPQADRRCGEGPAAGLALTIALLCLGPAGAEVATIVAAYIAWLGVWVTWFPLQPQQQPDWRSPNRLPTAPSPESGITHRRVPISRALKLRITAIAVVIALVALAIFLGISAPLSSSKTFSVAGDVTLLQEDKWLNHQHVLVFQLPDGQYRIPCTAGRALVASMAYHQRRARLARFHWGSSIRQLLLGAGILGLSRRQRNLCLSGRLPSAGTVRLRSRSGTCRSPAAVRVLASCSTPRSPTTNPISSR